MPERLSLARIMQGVAGAGRRNLASLGLLWLLTTTTALMLDFGTACLLEALDVQHGLGTSLLAGQISSLGLFTANGGIVLVVAADLQGRKVDVPTALVAASRMSGRMLGVLTLTGVAIDLGNLALVVPGIMLALRWSVTEPVRALEGVSVAATLRRSSELTDGNRGRLFLLGLVIVAASWLTGAVLELAGLNADSLSLDGGFLTLPRLVQVVMDSLYEVVGAVGATVCYVELRRLWEGDGANQVAAVFT